MDNFTLFLICLMMSGNQDYFIKQTFADSQRKISFQKSVRNVVEKIRHKNNTFKQSPKTTGVLCNITKHCHPCPEGAIRDDAEYCVPTGWRQMLTCVNQMNNERESVFQSCEALKSYTTPTMEVVQFESFVLVVLALAWVWRRRRLQDKGTSQ